MHVFLVIIFAHIYIYANCQATIKDLATISAESERIHKECFSCKVIIRGSFQVCVATKGPAEWSMSQSRSLNVLNISLGTSKPWRPVYRFAGFEMCPPFSLELWIQEYQQRVLNAENTLNSHTRRDFAALFGALKYRILTSLRWALLMS